MIGRIRVTPGVCGGRPCIRKTRIPVGTILDYLAHGLASEEIADVFLIDLEDVQAAIAWAEKGGEE